MGNKKHAYLVMAHNNFNCLKRLLCSLDYELNDIYIHMDKKAGDFDRAALESCVKKSELFFVDRVSVYWGDVSLVEAEYKLFMAAAPKHYERYHVISGVTLALKSQEEIHKIYEGDDRLWFAYHGETEEDPFLFKTENYYYWNREAMKAELKGIKLFSFRVKSRVLKLLDSWNKLVGKTRNDKPMRINGKKVMPTYYKGDNWVSLPDDFVQILVANERSILKRYRYTYCPDELFIPTLAMNTGFENRMYNETNTLIDWERGRPYVFTDNDLEELKASEYQFVRKISDEASAKLLDYFKF